jgi:hypothetical protein
MIWKKREKILFKRLLLLSDFIYSLKINYSLEIKILVIKYILNLFKILLIIF